MSLSVIPFGPKSARVCSCCWKPGPLTDVTAGFQKTPLVSCILVYTQCGETKPAPTEGILPEAFPMRHVVTGKILSKQALLTTAQVT